MRCDL